MLGRGLGRVELDVWVYSFLKARQGSSVHLSMLVDIYVMRGRPVGSRRI